MASEYKCLKQTLQHLGKAYEDALSRYSEAFEDFKKIELKKTVSTDEISLLDVRHAELSRIFIDYINCKHEFRRCKEELKAYYMENDTSVEEEFINAWKRAFTAYTMRPQYKDIRADYDKCMALQDEIENATPLTNEQKIIRFKEHLEINWQSYAQMIQSDIALCHMLCGKLQDDITAAEEQLSELKKYGSEFDDKKYALWMEYKPVYELYNHCIGGKV